MNVSRSITSNRVKLFKHLFRLRKIQSGRPAPVEFHVAPTNRCNLSCEHCCFSGRNRTSEIPLDALLEATGQIQAIGSKSIEITGGGEPTLYPHLKKWLDKIRLSVGMNTNALYLPPGLDWSRFSWVRVSLNVLGKGTFEQNVRRIQEQTDVTACYIASHETGLEELVPVVRFADQHKIPTRIAPDCIQEKHKIRETIERIRTVLRSIGAEKHELIFLSDFNVFLGERPDNICLIHALKPCLAADGWVYACPSSELAIENGRDLREEFRVCRMEDIQEYYEKPLEPRHHACSYCKYTDQNNILSDLLVPTKHNDFC